MSRIIYQDETITEYDDGTEEVHFTDAEWAVMMADPVRFGYACPGGHAWSRAEQEHGHCYACECSDAHSEEHDDECPEPTDEDVDVLLRAEESPVDPEEHDGEDIPF